MSSERRREPRVRIQLRAERILRGRVEPMGVVDASYCGLLLRTATAPALNQLMKLRVWLPSRDGTERGSVITLYPVPVREALQGGLVVVGCRLFPMPGIDMEEWRSFVTAMLRSEAKAA